MRLLECRGDGTYRLTPKILDDELPRYAILSHTWGPEDEEVTYEDLRGPSVPSKSGYRKIRYCGRQALKDDLQYFWVDSCCIDRSSSAELAEAINSMYRWYQNAAKCYVYLADVSVGNQVSGAPYFINTGRLLPDSSSLRRAFQSSRWWTRGWTLQELIAPKDVHFYSAQWKYLGDKKFLDFIIQEISGIPIQALHGAPLSEFSIKERISWSDKRQTKYEEDRVYSLLGLFGVFMPPLYGERTENAFRRLREEIRKSLIESSNQNKELSSMLFDHWSGKAYRWYCNECGSGPNALWMSSCVDCGHSWCLQCDGEYE